MSPNRGVFVFGELKGRIRDLASKIAAGELT